MRLRQCLCRGTVRLVAGLEALGMMGQKAGEWPEFRFTSPEIVHRERFRAFQSLDVSRGGGGGVLSSCWRGLSRSFHRSPSGGGSGALNEIWAGLFRAV